MFSDRVQVTPKRTIVREKGKKMQILEFDIPETDNAMFYRAMGLEIASGRGGNKIPLTPNKGKRVDEFLDAELFPHLLQTSKNAGRNEALDQTVPIIEGLEDENEAGKNPYQVFDEHGDPHNVSTSEELLKTLKKSYAGKDVLITNPGSKANPFMDLHSIKKSTFAAIMTKNSNQPIPIYKKPADGSEPSSDDQLTYLFYDRQRSVKAPKPKEQKEAPALPTTPIKVSAMRATPKKTKNKKVKSPSRKSYK